MRPPVCAICGKEFDPSEEGGVIYFAKRQSDIKWDKKMEEIGGVGHPPYADWFCSEHYPQAKELAGETISDAMKKLRELLAEKKKE